MAAYRLHRAADLLSRLRQARQPLDECHRHRRPRSLEALLHDAGRAARLVQRPSLARTEGSRRNRERRLGAQNAAGTAAGLSRGESRTRSRRAAEAVSDRTDRALLRCHSRRRAGIPRGPSAIGPTREARPKTARPYASPNRTQSPLAPRNAQTGHVALSSRSDGALHQQSSRARRAHDEAPAENLRRLSLGRRRDGLRAHPIPLLDRQEAGLERHRCPHLRPSELGEIPASFMSQLGNLASNEITKDDSPGSRWFVAPSAWPPTASSLD